MSNKSDDAVVEALRCLFGNGDRDHEVLYSQLFANLNSDESMNPLTYPEIDEILKRLGFEKIRARSGPHRDKTVIRPFDVLVRMGALHENPTKAQATNVEPAVSRGPEQSAVQNLGASHGREKNDCADEILRIIRDLVRAWGGVALQESVLCEAAKLGYAPYDAEEGIRHLLRAGKVIEVHDGIYRTVGEPSGYPPGGAREGDAKKSKKESVRG